MKRAILALMLLAALVGTSVLTAAQETLSAGSFEGTLEDETATYRLTAEEGQVFFLYLNSADFDTFIEILNKQGDAIDSDDDSGSDSNAALLFMAPDSATYDVTVRAYNGSATGDYTLTVVTEIPEIEIGSSVELDIDGVTPLVFRYEADGNPINIIVDSGGKTDTGLQVISPDGYMVQSSDDAIGPDPAFMPVILSEGVYYLVLSPYAESEVGKVSLSIEAVELKVLGDEPAIFTFGEAGRESIATFDVVEGTLYRIEVSNTPVSDFNLSLAAADNTLYTYGYFSYTNGLGGTYLYRADITGSLEVQISAGYMMFRDEPVDYTITVTEVSEQ